MFQTFASCLLRLLSVLWRCWLGGRKGIRPVKKTEWWGAGVLFVWSKVQTCILPSWCHRHSLSLASVKSRLVLPFRYRLTRVVPEKRAVKRVCVCVCVCACYFVSEAAVKMHPFVHEECSLLRRILVNQSLMINSGLLSQFRLRW